MDSSFMIFCGIGETKEENQFNLVTFQECRKVQSFRVRFNAEDSKLQKMCSALIILFSA